MEKVNDPAVRLAECRGYSASATVASSTADRFVACQAPAFDEAAERVKFENWAACAIPGLLPFDKYNSGDYRNESLQRYLIGWLACAKSRAGVK